MYQMVLDNDLIVDNFAGGGGASCGIEMALGRIVNVAVNHDPEAIGMHRVNHPLTEHLQDNVWNIRPREICKGRRISLAWFSPDCKHFSKAKGGKPVEKKIRGLAWVVLKWASLPIDEGKPAVIFLENVEEFVNWGPLVNNYPCPKRKGETFRAFVRALERHGYVVEKKELRACDYGAPTIRKRLFLIARCDGQPIIWPKPTHGPEGSGLLPYRTAADCIDWSVPCLSIFDRPRPLAKNTLRRIGKGMKKFVIEAERPFLIHTAHSDVGKNGRKRWGKGEHSLDEPLQTVTASNNMAIITPYLTEHANASGQRVFNAHEPLRTQVAQVKGGHFALCEGFLVGAGGPSYSGKPTSLKSPMGTMLAENHKQVCTAFLAQHNTQRQGYNPGRPADEPISTITGRGTQQQLVTSHIMKMRGHSSREKHGQPSDEPLHTISAGGLHHAHVNAFLIKYFGTDQDPRMEEPMHTVTTKDRFAVVQVASEITGNLTEEQRYNAWWTMRFLEEYEAVPVIEGLGVPRPSFLMLGDYIMYDIGMRMLVPRELYRAQSFPDSYIIDYALIAEQNKQGEWIVTQKPLSKKAQVRMCGNSVCPVLVKALVQANYPGLMIDRSYIDRVLTTPVAAQIVAAQGMA
jgi:DNA (cytosine-5)-methyltransferase 1